MKKEILIFIVMLAVSLGGYAQTTANLYVDKDVSGGDGTSWASAYSNLQIAIDNSTTGDVIFVKNGEYPLTAAIVLNLGPEIYGSFTGTETTLEDRDLSNFSNDANNATILKSNGGERVISINPGASPVFDGLVITGGGNVDKGGGIYVYNASPVLRNLIITANIASGSNGSGYQNGSDGYGGGMYNAGASSPTLTNVIISGNTAKGGNGGSTNSNPPYSGGDGGGGYGGGMYNENTSAPSLTNVIFMDNSSSGGLAGMGDLYDGDGGGGYGGGLYNANSSAPSLINVTISGNIADGVSSNGGGVYNESSSLPKLYNTILLGNTATNNSGVFNDGTLPDIQYSLIEGETGGSNGNLDATSLTDTDIFTNPANGDYSLKKRSPAANTGSNALYDNVGDLTNDVDIAGNLRVYDGTPVTDVIDMGAYELQRDPAAPIFPDASNILYVNKNVSSGNESGNTWESAIPELADALLWAKQNEEASWATTPLKILVAKGTYKPMYSPEDGVNFGTDQGRDNTFLLVKNVQLYGGFDPANGIVALTDKRIPPINKSEKGTILDGDIGTLGDTQDNIYHIVLSVNSVGSALLDGFKITNGNQTDGNGFIKIDGVNVNKGLGAGMCNISSSPKLTNVMLSGNNAKDYGGGMYNNGSSPTLFNVILSDNSAGSAAGGMFNTASSPTLINVTLSGNNAFVDGGISIRSGSSPKLYNTIVVGNTATNSPDLGAAGSTPDVQYSLIGGFNVGATNLDGTSISKEDIFTDPANGYYSLKGTSPALNAGDNTLYTNAGGDLVNDVDLAGNLRVYDGTPVADGIDMGAYELQRDPVLPITPDAGNILYVNKNVSGGNETGDSWANAIPELADALIRAEVHYNASWASTPLQIFVAKGTYKPLYSPEYGVNYSTDQARNNSFLMIKNVQLYGGFAGTETALLDRDLSVLANKTTLSGDIGIENDASDNIYNVLVSAGDIGTASLDGFSITGGNANAYTDIYVNGSQVFKCSGAGVYNSVSSPSYKNLILHNNICTESGGGMFSYMSSPKLQLVILKNNQAKDGGGIANQEKSSPMLLNVSIESNTATENGSGMYNVDESEPTLTNVSIVGNESSVSSEEVPGCTALNSTVTLYNSIVWDVVTGDYTAQNSLIKGNTDISDNNIDASGLTDIDIFNDPANGDYSLKGTSPALNVGSSTLYANAGGDLASDLDIAGNLRVNEDGPAAGIIDIGAYEFYKADQSITFNALAAVTFGDANFTLNATTGSGLDITYTSSDETVATISGNEVSIVGLGTTTITASQAGNANYKAATDVNRDLTVEKIGQSITFNALAAVTFGDGNFTLNATTDSGLDITYVSSNTEVATITGNEVTIIGAGTTTITASAAENADYKAATDVAQDLVVNKAEQTITIEAITDKEVSSAPITVVASTSSQLALTYEVSGPATIESNIVSLNGNEGTVTVTVRQAGNENYTTATATASFEVSDPCINFSAEITATNLLCNADASGTIEVTATGTAPFSYSLNGQTAQESNVFAGLAADTYEIMVTDANGCNATLSTTLTEPALLTLTAEIVESTSVFGNGSISTTVSGGTGVYTYDWSNGASSATINELGIGEYSLTVTDENGCTVTKSFTVGGITASKKNEAISVNMYPNPTVDILTIKHTDLIKSIRLYDAQGKAIQTISINSKEAKIGMAQYPAGLYYLQIDGSSEMYRFIKQ